MISPWARGSHQRPPQMILLPAMCLCASRTSRRGGKIGAPHACGDPDVDSVHMVTRRNISTHVKMCVCAPRSFVRKGESPCTVVWDFLHQNMEVSFKVQNLLSSRLIFKTFRHCKLQFKFKVTDFIHMLT